MLQKYFCNVRSVLACPIFFGLFIFSNYCISGVSDGIVAIDQENRKPVAYASVLLKEINGKGELSGFLDQNGWISTENMKYPLQVKIIHVNHLAFSGTVSSPDTLILDLKNEILEEVVVTGQYEPEPLRNSLIRVQTIEPRGLENRGAATLSQALQYQLNYTLEPDPATGAVGISIQGLDSRQVKILLDGVPISGRTGNSIDLSQINISAVERIEVVEGPLAVQYGTDAMAGVINIISKTSQKKKPYARVDILEESVGSDYGAEEGIHQQGVLFGMGVGKDFYGQLEFTHRFFGGYQGGIEGRAKLFDPKENIYGNLKLGFRPKRMKIEYRLDFFDELIDSKANPSGLIEPIALDEQYHTRRFINQLNGYNSLSNTQKIDWVASYTVYSRIKTQYAHNLATGEKPLVESEGAQDTADIQAFLFRGIYTTNPMEGKLSFQLGVDLNTEKARGGRIEGADWQSLGDYAGFGTMQIKASSRFSMRFGLRYSYHTNYNAPLLPSAHVKYALSPKLDFRLSYARGFRAPTLKELYFDFFDSNHSISGNESLQPEYSHHLDFGFNHRLEFGKGYILNSDLNFFYNDQNNQITFGQDALDPTITTYINADIYRTLGFSLRESLGINKFEIGAGIGVTGRYNEFSDSLKLDQYLFSPEINTSVAYTPGFWGLSFSLFYKYTGKVPQYLISEDDNGNQDVVLGERDPFQWMDLSVTKNFKKYLTLILGVKNLTNVTNVNQTISGGGTHGGGGQYPIGYGRSFFVRLVFKTQNFN